MSFNVGDTTIEASVDANDGSSDIVSQATVPAGGGFVQSISLYISPGHSVGTCFLGIYDNTGASGAPNKLLASTASFTLIDGWNTQPISRSVFVPASTIYLAFLPSSNSAGPVFKGSGTGYSLAGQVTLPDPYGAGSSQALTYSQYATLVAGMFVANPETILPDSKWA